MRLDFFVKLKKRSSTIILSVGIKYSVRDLIFGVNNYACPTKYLYVSHMVNDVSAPSGISWTMQAVNSIPEQSIRSNLCKMFL